MKDIHTIIRADAPTTDTETMGLIRASVLECKPGEHAVRVLLKQVQTEVTAQGAR